MKASHIFTFAAGAVLALGASLVSQSYAQSANHVFELRMYRVNEGKMENLKSRFGDHTDKIFKKHNMKSLGYWVAEPNAAPNSNNLFVYLVQHPSKAEADKNWQAFVDDPDWKSARAASEKNGVLVEEKNVTRYFMDPTTFSALK